MVPNQSQKTQMIALLCINEATRIIETKLEMNILFLINVMDDSDQDDIGILM